MGVSEGKFAFRERGSCVETKKDGRGMNISVFGIGFPGDRPGYAALLELNGWTVKLQREFEANTLDELLSKCCLYKRNYHDTYPIAGFIGRKEDAVMAFIKDHNKEPLNERIVFTEAPNVEKTGKITYHINSVLNVLRNDNKRLYLMENSKVLSYLQSIPKTGAADITDKMYPAVAALGYGTTYLLNRAGEMKKRNERIRRGRANAWTV